MIYQLGLIALLILIALIVSKRLNKKDTLVFEDDMEDEELKKIDDEML
jgi:hypothetical protein|tara:strand:- start:1878 stop:2021 length:144 start_codon:yes stop_codon:yes gene_type:complete